MCRLYGRHHAVFSEKFKIFLIDHLRVFYSPSSIVLPFKIFSIDVEDRAVAAIANGMRTHLKISAGNPFCTFIEMRRIAEKESIMTWLVTVWFNQAGTA